MVVAQAAGQVSLNGARMPLSQLPGELDRIFRTRAERIVMVSADASASMADLTGMIDVALTQVDRVAWVTPASDQSCHGLPTVAARRVAILRK